MKRPGPKGKGHPQIVEREAQKVTEKSLLKGFAYGHSLSDQHRRLALDEIIDLMNDDDKYFFGAARSDFTTIQAHSRVIYRLSSESY